MRKIVCLYFCALICLGSCSHNNKLDEGIIKVNLLPVAPGENISLRWSPKGEKLNLRETEDGLFASLYLGPKGLPPINLLLKSSSSDPNYDQLDVDLNRDGSFGGVEDTSLYCTPSERRGKIWSSFSGSVNIPFEKSEGNQEVVNPYPVSFWYVFDPLEPDAEKVIRFSRRGWMQGEVQTDIGKISLLITESRMDGVFDRSDSWAISMDSTQSELFNIKSSRQIDTHNWLGEQAYGIDSLLPSGRVVWIKPVDPMITRAEEEAQKDYLAPDRETKRSGGKVNFYHDYKSAKNLAVKNNKKLFIDFETTWCGPCKTMDQWVYTADEVIAATSDIVCVKVDGDENRELVKQFEVTAYPTLILVSPEGKILKKAIGYQSVVKTVDFMNYVY